MAIEDLPVFQSKKKEGLTKFVLNVLNPIVNFWLDVSYDFDTAAYDFLKSDEPGLILPNHRYMADIPLIGLPLKHFFSSQAHYIMKATLPSSFEYLGGVPIIRKKDIEKGSSNREIILKAKERDNEIYSNIIPSILAQSGRVVIYTETTRSKNSPILFSLATSFNKKFKKIEENLGSSITYVPVSLCYKNGVKFRSKVEVEFLEPVTVSVVDGDKGFTFLKDKLEYLINGNLKNQG
ncbi:1-acyl-sn-glycerol-3-phosphate acyltransferase [Candidatus Woesearchaeota archaeon]|nr:1-acyl-sn-glycerol-3-phosphate acyltransferase [Candidatus Woesearchaeota archaeon]